LHTQFINKLQKKAHIGSSESAGVIECSGSIALAKLLHSLKVDTRVRIVGVTSANAAGVITTIIAGGLAEVQHAIEHVKLLGNENVVFFARPDKEAMSLLLKSLLIAESEPKVEIIKESRVRDIDDLHISEIASWNVHELRRYARSLEAFPIKGRNISKATRSELLNLLHASGYIYLDTNSPRVYPPANMMPS
jgi:microcompartment protein CcmL/EutN